MPGNRNRISTVAVMHATVMILLLSWRFGGLEPQTQTVAGILLLPSPLVTVLAVCSAETRFRWRIIGILVPFAVLAVAVSISAANPYMRLVYAEGSPIGMAPREDYIHALPSTAWPWHSLRDFVFNTGLVLVGLNVLLARPPRRALLFLIGAIATNGALLACAGTVFKLSQATKILGIYNSPNPNFFSTFVYYNHWGAFALLCTAAAAALVFHFARKAGVRRWYETPAPLFLVVGLITLVSIPLSGGRASLLGAGLLVLLLGGKLVSRASSTRHLKYILFVGAGGSAMILASMFWLARDRPQFWADKTTRQWNEAKAGGLGDARLVVYRQTWQLFLARPVYGWGWQSFRYAYRQIQTNDFKMQTEQHEASVFLDAHNDWLQKLAELGLVGLAISFWAVWAIARMAPRHLWTVTPSFELLAGLTALCLIAIIDFPFACPVIVLTSWTLLAVAAAISYDRDPQSLSK